MPKGLGEGDTLATFKISKEKWEQFKEKSGNASRLLNAFIESYLLNLVDTDSWVSEKDTKSAIFEYVAELESRLDYKMQVAIAKLRKEMNNKKS